MSGSLPVSRRCALACLAAAPFALHGQGAQAFGLSGAFHPRLLVSGDDKVDAVRSEGASRWAWELVRRTSAPARLSAPAVVTAADPALLEEPFALWTGEAEVAPLDAVELRNLQLYLKLGGLLVVDDMRPEVGSFTRSARRELARLSPDSALVPLAARHVIFKSFYLVEAPVGRSMKVTNVQGIIRGRTAQVLLLEHDLLGALAHDAGGSPRLEVSPGGYRQREFAVRFAVNLAMYLLCSDYKDDQVHAEWLMRRRHAAP